MPGEWSIAAALDRAFHDVPGRRAGVGRARARAAVDLTPDWLADAGRPGLSPGAGLVGAMIADRDDIVLHAGWDVPNYRWYELEGLRVGDADVGQRPADRTRVQPGQPRRRGDLRRRTGASSAIAPPAGSTLPAGACRGALAASARERCGPPTPASTRSCRSTAAEPLARPRTLRLTTRPYAVGSRQTLQLWGRRHSVRRRRG